MKKLVVILAIVSMLCAVSTASASTSPVRAHAAITGYDVYHQHFYYYIRGRCGLKVGPLPIWNCKGFIIHGCKQTGVNVYRRNQWYCLGEVFESRGWANIGGSPGRQCAVSAAYWPDGHRSAGYKDHCIATGGSG